MIDRAEFGRTGHASSRVIFGAAALGRMSQERADELEYVRDWFPALRDLYQHAADTDRVVICETIS